MQLKRLRRTGFDASQQADDSKAAQDISESQLLRELEDLTGGFAADDSGSAQALDAAPLAAPAVTIAAVAGSNETPAAGTVSRRRRSSGLTSSAKRQSREFKSLFSSQDDEQQQQPPDGGLGLTGSDRQQGQDDVDLDTLPWMQPQTTPPAATAAGGSSSGIGPAPAAAHRRDSNEALGDDAGWHMGRNTSRTATQLQQQQQHSRLHMQHNSSHLGKQQQQQQQQQQQHRHPPLHSRQMHDEDQEDPISVDSDSDDEEPGGCRTAPGLAAATAARSMPRTVTRLPADTMTSPRSSIGQQQQQQRRQQQHTPGARALTRPYASGADCHTGQQQQQQQPRRSAGMCDLSRLLQPTPPARAAAAAAAGTPSCMDVSPLDNAGQCSTGVQCDGGDHDEDAWQPPKYKRQQQPQQQQQPLSSTGRPPAGRKVQPVAEAGSFGRAGTPSAGGGFAGSRFDGAPPLPAGAAGAETFNTMPAAAMGFGGGNAAAAAAAAARSADNGDLRPWWTVLDDFVPVEVLVQSLVNPRDNTIVHINYKSQFKEGPATARSNTGAAAGSRSAAPSSRKKSATGARGKRGAAAAAGAGGFMTAGALAASQPAAKKGRRGSRKAGSGKGRGSGGGSSGGSKKRKGRGKRQGWRTIAGKKVFVDASGRQLSGGAAYQAYKGGDN